MKNTKLQVTAIFNWIVFSYLILVGVLYIGGKVVFGHGLGDLFYLAFIIVCLLVHIGLNLLVIYKARGNHKYIWHLIVAFIFLTFAIIITWKFTYGRGSESKWNGYIFY